MEISQTRPPRLVEGLLDANEHTLALSRMEVDIEHVSFRVA